MKKHFLKVALGFIGLMGALVIGVTKAEYSQVINITGFDVNTPNQLIQSFTQKRDDLELYFVSSTGNISHYTIMDRNMGATEVYNQQFVRDASVINTGSFGYHYQWGNNYGFAPCINDPLTENTCYSFPNNETTTYSIVPKAIWSQYVPSKYARNLYFSNPKWMTGDAPGNNIRGGAGDTTGSNGDGTLIGRNNSWNTLSGRQGPCPNGYYIPSIYDWITIGTTWKDSTQGISNPAYDLLLPPAGRRSYNDGRVSFQGYEGEYRSSSSISTGAGRIVFVTSSRISPDAFSNSVGESLRCTKFSPNSLNFNVYMNGGTKAVIAFTGNVGEGKITTLSTPIKSNYIFLGRYDAENNGNEIKTGSIVPNNLYAKWGGCKDGYEENEEKTECLMKTYTITYNLNGGTNSTLNPGTYTVETPTIILQDATRNGSVFDGWYSDENFTTKVTVIGGGNIGDITLYAKWGCEDGYIENEEKTACEKIGVEFDANGGTFSDNNNIYTVIKSKQVLGKIMRTLHTANLDDNGNYTNEFNGQPMNGYTTSIAQYTSGGVTTYPIYSPSLMYFEEENMEKLDISIKYGGSPYCTPGYIIVWTGDHRQFDANYNPGNTGLSVLYIGDFSSYGENSEKSVEIEGDSFTIYQNNGCPSYGFFANISWEGVVDLAYEDDAFDNIPEPTREGHSFKGWYLTDGTKFNTGNVSTGEIIKAYAKWECAQGYEDKGGECVKKSSGSSGGGGRGGGGATKPDTPKEEQKPADTSEQVPQSDNSASSGANVKTPENNSSEQTPQNDSNTPMDSSISSQNNGKTYSTEFQEAYEFAKGKGITTMPTIQKADMDGKLTRIAMAKMLSQYAMNVLGQKPANIITPKFNDVTEKMDSDYDDGVTLAYQLGIMGQNMSNNKFRPNDEVTRGEFVTALSRMLYNTSDGEYRSTPKYYTHHMEKMEGEGIITNTNPNMKELRGYVMIMLMRSAK